MGIYSKSNQKESMKKPEGYNEGNEQYAYLVTWCVEQLEDFIECKRKEKRMTRKMTKQDGN